MALFEGTWRNKVNQMKHDAQDAFDRKCNYMASWWDVNKEWAIVVLPVAAGLTVKAFNVATKAINAYSANKTAQVQACTMWDPVKQIHVVTKHPLTRIELEDYMRLTNSGMTVSDALMTLNLI